MTLPPSFAANWVAKEPTPPPAPTISTVLSASGSIKSTNARPVPPTVGSAAATTSSRPLGTRANGASSVTATYSAYVPAEPSGAINNWPNRSSPRENFDAPSPSCSTTPAPSAPSTIGNVAGMGFQAPEASVRSIGFMPGSPQLDQDLPWSRVRRRDLRHCRSGAIFSDRDRAHDASLPLGVLGTWLAQRRPRRVIRRHELAWTGSHLDRMASKVGEHNRPLDADQAGHQVFQVRRRFRAERDLMLFNSTGPAKPRTRTIASVSAGRYG